ncbi:MAG: bacteriochlorophyll 4-vinyl reductase [Pseudomonadota bacterium]
MVALAVSDAPAAPHPSPGLVGPNAVIQLRHALVEGAAPGEAARVFALAGQSAHFERPPEAMIDETIPAALFAALWRALPERDAARLARDAGERTADYVMTHRIPAFARALLRNLPRGLAARLLLRAIARNAWTFAGSGRCEVETGTRLAIVIHDNTLATPGCVWHAGVFTRLFDRLVAPGTSVIHTACTRRGDALCRFEIALNPKTRRTRTR